VKSPTIQVYWNGHDISRPWIVSLHDGVAVERIFLQTRNPTKAVRHALDVVAVALNLPVVWPQWLKVKEVSG
jgi:hypothetical protein